jgi:uncharacterized protein (TIGR02266 family)
MQRGMQDVASQFREYVRLDRLRRHDGLSPAELERWKLLKRKLARHFSPGISDARADQRESVRVPSRLTVSFGSENELVRSLMTNLSRKGLFVCTEDVLEMGTRLDLCIHVDRPDREITVRVEVVSRYVGPNYAQETGMGMRFLDMPPDVEKQIEELYEQLAR